MVINKLPLIPTNLSKISADKNAQLHNSIDLLLLILFLYYLGSTNKEKVFLDHLFDEL